MNKKKIFGISAVVIMILVTITPGINSIRQELQNINDFKIESDKSKLRNWDLKVTLSDVTFLYYDEKEDIAFYKIVYIIENVGNNYYIGYPKTILKVHNEQWEIASWNWPEILPLRLWPGKNKTINIVQPIDYENERFLSGKTVDLETGIYDASGSEDPKQGNNIGVNFGKYWEKTGKYYIPSENHLKATLPNEEWIESYEVFNFPDITVKVPIFSETYLKFVLPTFLSSERIGWIGVLINFFISACRAFCNFSREFFDVASLIALTAGELFLLLTEIIGTITAVAKGKIIVTFVLVSSIFSTISTISATLGKLFAEIKELPIDPNNPLRVALADAVDSFYSFLSVYPWYEDVTIEGELNNCRSYEKIKVSCRNVTDKDIPGGSGYREIESFSVNTTWKLKYLDGLFFRCCQVKFKGSEHTNQKLKSRRIFSYVAPGGTLKIIAGFKNARFINQLQLNFLQRIFRLFPFLKHIGSATQFQPSFGEI